MQRVTTALALAFIATAAMLGTGCNLVYETGDFYNRMWYEQHLVLAGRDDLRTHYVELETFAPGHHYAAEATVRPLRPLTVHAKGETIGALDLTPAIMRRWERQFFSAAQGHHSVSVQDDHEFFILRSSGQDEPRRILQCGFRKSDGMLTSFAYRVIPDARWPLDETPSGPFRFSLGDGPLMSLPVRTEKAAELLGA